MNKAFLLLSLVFLAGCVVTTQEASLPTISETTALRNEKGLTNIGKVYVGMTFSEVKTVMGNVTTIGYEKSPLNTSGNEAITIKNPYREETLDIKGKQYLVAYYFINVLKSDEMVSDDELIPLVFLNDYLVGKGWDFFIKLKN